MSTALAPRPSKDALREIRRLEEQLARAIISAVKQVWPDDLDGQYTVVHRNRKVKVIFNPPHQKEPGWVDG